jgi:hypothetical protein
MPKTKARSLLDAADAVEVTGGAGGQTQETKNIFVPASRLEEFSAALLEHYPDGEIYPKTIASGGKNPNGERNVSLAYRQTNPNGMATVWLSGKATLTGVMTDLPWK